FNPAPGPTGELSSQPYADDRFLRHWRVSWTVYSRVHSGEWQKLAEPLCRLRVAVIRIVGVPFRDAISFHRDKNGGRISRESVGQTHQEPSCVGIRAGNFLLCGRGGRNSVLDRKVLPVRARIERRGREPP